MFLTRSIAVPMNKSVSKSITKHFPVCSCPLLIGRVHPLQKPVSINGRYSFEEEYLIPIILMPDESGDGRKSIGRWGHLVGGDGGIDDSPSEKHGHTLSPAIGTVLFFFWGKNILCSAGRLFWQVSYIFKSSHSAVEDATSLISASLLGELPSEVDESSDDEDLLVSILLSFCARFAFNDGMMIFLGYKKVLLLCWAGERKLIPTTYLYSSRLCIFSPHYLLFSTLKVDASPSPFE